MIGILTPESRAKLMLVALDILSKRMRFAIKRGRSDIDDNSIPRLTDTSNPRLHHVLQARDAEPICATGKVLYIRFRRAKI